MQTSPASDGEFTKCRSGNAFPLAPVPAPNLYVPPGHEQYFVPEASPMICVGCRSHTHTGELSPLGMICEKCATARSQNGSSLLRLLVLLANCGLAAAAPPLLSPSNELGT